MGSFTQNGTAALSPSAVGHLPAPQPAEDYVEGAELVQKTAWVAQEQKTAHRYSWALQQCIAPALPGFISLIVISTVYLFCSGLDNEDGRHSAPLTETLHCTSTRRESSRYAGETGVGIKSGGQYPAYRFYERPLRGFDPFDGPMCIESTCASDSAV